MARDWDITPNRCGGCTRFERDYGSGGVAYGHCNYKPRSGSIQSDRYKCDSYNPLPEVAPAKVEAAVRKPRIDVFADPASLQSRVKARPSTRSKSPTRRRAITTVVRRPSRNDRDAELVELEDLEMDRAELKQIIQEAIEESMGVGEPAIVDRFAGGTVEIRPGNNDTASKEIPIDTLFRKIVMIRDNLRVLEQKINQHPGLGDPDRVGLQQYITRCYGSLTTFNVLFQEKEDRFSGSTKE